MVLGELAPKNLAIGLVAADVEGQVQELRSSPDGGLTRLREYLGAVSGPASRRVP